MLTIKEKHDKYLYTFWKWYAYENYYKLIQDWFSDIEIHYRWCKWKNKNMSVEDFKKLVYIMIENEINTITEEGFDFLDLQYIRQCQ